MSEMDTQLIQQLIHSDADSDTQLGLVLKTVYASENPASFIRSLDKFITKKEEEIEKICVASYRVRLSLVMIHFRCVFIPFHGVGIGSFHRGPPFDQRRGRRAAQKCPDSE